MNSYNPCDNYLLYLDHYADTMVPILVLDSEL